LRNKVFKKARDLAKLSDEYVMIKTNTESINTNKFSKSVNDLSHKAMSNRSKSDNIITPREKEKVETKN